jgi:hypothetical protein
MKHLMIVMMTLLIPAAAIAKTACKADKEKFCNKGMVAACLKQHEIELSEVCKAQLDVRSKANEETAATACKDDKLKFCKEVTVEGCLKQHETELSEACKAELDVGAKAIKD